MHLYVVVTMCSLGKWVINISDYAQSSSWLFNGSETAIICGFGSRYADCSIKITASLIFVIALCLSDNSRYAITELEGSRAGDR